MLYNKYRPTLFKDVVGQNFSKDLLTNILTTQSDVHSFIFYGPNGTGKTTMARLFAQALNCSKFKKLQEICQSCSACKLIQDNTSTDIIEIDGATHNGVEYIRDITRNSIYPPLQLEKKLYIIDEAHCLSTQSWNALLKLIEEPPSHLVLIFLTTSIHKVIPTILSRCQKLQFPPLESAELLNLLENISQKEGKKLDSDILSKIVEGANGSAREAIVLLEKSLLNTTSSANLLKNLTTLKETASTLLKLLFKSDYPKALELLKSNLSNVDKLWSLLLDKLLELSFFELSSHSTELLSLLDKDEATELLKSNPNLNSMINFLAPILSNNNLPTSLAYSKFILLNLFKSCYETTQAPIQEVKEIIKPIVSIKKVPKEEPVSLTLQSTQAKVENKEKEDDTPISTKTLIVPPTKELFSHNFLTLESYGLPNFKFEQLLAKEKEIILLLRATDKKISKDNYALLQKYLSEDEKNPSIVQLFSKINPKYELICSNDSCIAVFESEAESDYFNLKTKNLELRELLYNIFSSEIKWRGITLYELQQAIKKNKKYKIKSDLSSANTLKNEKLFEEVKAKYFPEKALKKS